jgi:hypothetical protein
LQSPSSNKTSESKSTAQKLNFRVACMLQFLLTVAALLC